MYVCVCLFKKKFVDVQKSVKINKNNKEFYLKINNFSTLTAVWVCKGLILWPLGHSRIISIDTRVSVFSISNKLSLTYVKCDIFALYNWD